jgi:hypothetical protein
MLRQELRDLKQTGTVQDYNEKWDALMFQIPAQDYNVDDLVLDYSNGLKRQVKEFIDSNFYETFEDLQRAAIRRGEALDNRPPMFTSNGFNKRPGGFFTRNFRNNPNQVSPKTLYTGPQAMEIDALSHQEGQHLRPDGKAYQGYANRPRSILSNRIKCYNCNGFGHISRNCPSAPTKATQDARVNYVQGHEDNIDKDVNFILGEEPAQM